MRIAWLVFASQYVCLDNPSAFRHHRGMCLMQDLISPTRLLAFCKLMPWPSKSSDLNPIKRNWDVIGRGFRRRGLANVRRFTCTAISNGQMERNYTAHVERLGYMYVALMRSHCQNLIEANGGHSRYNVQ